MSASLAIWLVSRNFHADIDNGGHFSQSFAIVQMEAHATPAGLRSVLSLWHSRVPPLALAEVPTVYFYCGRCTEVYCRDQWA